MSTRELGTCLRREQNLSIFARQQHARRVLNPKVVFDMNKKDAMLNPESEVHLRLNLPEDIDTYKKLQRYLWQNFRIDVDLSEELFGDLFYNTDLRSFMGFVYDFGNPCYLVLFPQYYIEKDNPSSSWSKLWRQLVRQSEVVEPHD